MLLPKTWLLNRHMQHSYRSKRMIHNNEQRMMIAGTMAMAAPWDSVCHLDRAGVAHVRHRYTQPHVLPIASFASACVFTI